MQRDSLSALASIDDPFSILAKHAEATRLRHNIGDTFSDVGWQNDITKVQHHNGIRCETPLYEPQRHYEAL